MDFGGMIKRAWRITWRYKALWILGVFAGVSGCQPSGNGSSNWNTSSSDFGGSARDLDGFLQLQDYLPLLIGGLVLLVLIGLVWAIVGIAARGGLIHGVDAIERTGEVHLGEAWRVGWGKWWRLFGISLLLALPLIAIGIVFLVVVLLPILSQAGRGDGPSLAAFGPMCGVFLVGTPILIVVAILVGVLTLTAERYAVLGDRGVIDSISAAWTAFRVRVKDHLLMYLLSGALNLVAGIVLAIPVAILAAAILVPAFIAGGSGDGLSIGPIVSAGIGVVIVVMVLSAMFNAVWGTFSSALWTLFFRRLTGMDALPASMPMHTPMAPQATGQWGQQPPAPPMAPEQPPAPPIAPEQPPAPPMAPEQPPAPPMAPVPEPEPPADAEPEPPAPPVL